MESIIAETAAAVQALIGDAVDDWEFADLVDAAIAVRSR